MVLFLFFFSCTSPYPCWKLEKTIPNSTCCRSARATLPSQALVNGFDIELIRTREGIRIYANILSRPLQASPNNPHATNTIVIIEEISHHVEAYLMEGQQRVLFPPDITNMMIYALMGGQPVIIKIGPYQEEITPGNFSDVYYKLIKMPI